MTYTTVSGDMWDSIAYKQLGDERFKPDLMKANPSYIDTYIFTSGVVLTIPDVDEDEYDGTLPPWKQVNG